MNPTTALTNWEEPCKPHSCKAPLTGLQYCLNFRRKFLVLSYSPKTVMAFLSNEVTELRYICAVFLREVLAGDIFRARCSECVDLEISSGFDVSLFVVEEIIPFVCL